MFRQAGLLCVTLAMFSIAGGHWAVVQTVAWAEMLRSYTEDTGSLLTAVSQTFDGQHACALCQRLQAAKFREQQGSPAAFSRKDGAQLKAVTMRPAVAPDRQCAAAFVYPAATGSRALDRCEAPPTPPPRRLGSVA